MERVRILHVSDVHCDVARMRAVAAQAAQGRHDCIIVTGDLARYDHERHRGREMEAEADAHQVLLAVEEGHALPVYFLPGNHDAPALLAVPPVDARGRRAVNVHGCAAVPLAPGLSVCGLGGAVPAAQGGYIVWDGFPYTEQQMGVQLHALWETQLARAPDDQVLLLMHCGPYDAGTTVCFKDVTRDPIQSGSTNLRRLVCQQDVQQRAVALLHGHTHDASGMAQMGTVAIVNPGALCEGRFAELTLERRDGRWTLTDVRFARI